MEDVVPGSPSSVGSDSTDDAVNTSSAKIYFGQFQSSEKKLAALVNSTTANEHDSPTVTMPGPSSPPHSSRLPSLPVREEEEAPTIEESDQEEDEGEDTETNSNENQVQESHEGSWQDVPFLEFLRKDEPSSAIASRIMRAHDNPSPPPKAIRSSLTPRASFKLDRRQIFPHIPNSSEGSDAAVESLPDTGYRDSPTPPPGAPNVTPQSTATTQGQIARSQVTSLPPSQDAEANGEVDLISFDRSVLMSSPTQGVKLHSPSPQHPQQPTIDDLLFSSPPQGSSMRDMTQTSPREGDRDDTVVSSHQPEAQDNSNETTTLVGNAHIMKDIGAKRHSGVFAGPGFPKQVSGQPEAERVEDQPTPLARLVVPDASPSLRRSPRLSSLPLSTPQPMPRLLTPKRTPKPKTPNHDGSQTRKRRRSSTEKVRRKSAMPRTPKRRDFFTQSDESGSDVDPLESPSKKETRDRKRAKKGTGQVLNDGARLAESLSPGSANFLSSLIVSESKESSSQLTTEMVDPCTPIKPESLADDGNIQSPTKPSVSISSNVQRPPPGVFTRNILTPGPLNSTRTFFAPNSPVKLAITPAASDDPNRTPARRVPIKDVNRASDANNASLGQSNALRMPSRPPVFTRPAPPINDPLRSPAKRIPVSGRISKEPVGNARKTAGPLRGASAEPPQKVSNVDESEPNVHAEPKTGSAATSAASGSSSQSSESGSGGASKAPVTSKLPTKTGSRIPRPGAAPTAYTLKSKLPMPSTKRSTIASSSTPSNLQSARKGPLGRVGQLSSTSSSSDESTGTPSNPSAAGPSRSALANSLAKRKRDAEKPSANRTMIKMRQVVRGMYGGPTKPPILNGIEKAPFTEGQRQENSIKPQVPQRPIKAREVIKGTLRDFELTTDASKSLEALSEQRAREREELEKARREAEKSSSPPAPTLESFTFECAVPEQQKEQVDTESPAPSNSLPSSDDVEMANVPSPRVHNESGARRSSRARRPKSTDVFGTVSSNNLPSQAAGSRRKSASGLLNTRSTSVLPNLLFSTNGVALKSLTNNNTTRNQNYLAQLEMHIVRKPGNRPESPTMKLRTVLEKQKEDQGKMRAERARRRRGEGCDESGDIDMDEKSIKHRRGPGDEEDYETPVRPSDGRKTVKWDRGLEVSAFLDEIEVQPRKHRSKEGILKPRKGCLVSQRPQLDDLGNPVNMNAPLNVVPEKVVVTKFIYDNDEEALFFDPPAPKATRSKSKKK